MECKFIIAHTCENICQKYTIEFFVRKAKLLYVCIPFPGNPKANLGWIVFGIAIAELGSEQKWIRSPARSLHDGYRFVEGPLHKGLAVRQASTEDVNKKTVSAARAANRAGKSFSQIFRNGV